MNDCKKRFNEVFSEEGGRFDIMFYDKPDHFLSFMSDSKMYIEHINIKNAPYCLDFVNSTELNAYATKDEKGYMIGINMGTYTLYFSLFMRMASNPNVLKDFGNPEKEVEKKIFTAEFTDAFELYSSVSKDEINHPVLPKTEERTELGYDLINYALKFLVMHEYGHIVHGHVDLFNSSVMGFKMNEIKDEEALPRGLSSLDFQTMEIDADNYATYICVQQLILEYNHSKNQPELKDHYYSNIEKQLYIFVFSVYSSFRLFGFNKNDVDGLRVFEHPPAGIRQKNILNIIQEVFNSTNDLDREQYKDFFENVPMILNKAAQDVEEAFVYISEQQFDSSAFSFASRPECIKQYSQILNNWNKIKLLLKPFSKVDLDF